MKKSKKFQVNSIGSPLGTIKVRSNIQNIGKWLKNTLKINRHNK